VTHPWPSSSAAAQELITPLKHGQRSDMLSGEEVERLMLRTTRRPSALKAWPDPTPGLAGLQLG